MLNSKFKTRNSKLSLGITVIELTFSIVLLSIILAAVLPVFSDGTIGLFRAHQKYQAGLILDSKINTIRSLGYWVWEVDTRTPEYTGVSADPAVEWSDELAEYPMVSYGTIDVQPCSLVSGNLVNFSGADFEDNTARDYFIITLTLYLSPSGVLSKQIVLCISPTQKATIGILYNLKRALKLYYANVGSYPASNCLDLLVSAGYLVEIPNDPYTITLRKASHTEELLDYYYDNTGGVITLSPQAHRDWGISWGY